MTAQQRADRNAAVFEARARGFAWSRIAREFEISERQAQRICREQRRNRPAVSASDPLEMLAELLEGYDSATDELAELARDTSHDGTKLGAIRSRVQVMDSRAQLLAAAGLLPEDLGDLRLILDARNVTDSLFRVLDRHSVLTEEVLNDLLEELGGPPTAWGDTLALNRALPQGSEPNGNDS